MSRDNKTSIWGCFIAYIYIKLVFTFKRIFKCMGIRGGGKSAKL
jgi:hypothetical protein